MSKFRRTLSFLLALFLCTGLLPASVFAAEGAAGLGNFTKKNTWSDGLFADVAASDWFYGNVKSAYEYGLMIGKGEKSFDPDGNVTVAETLTVAARLNAIYTSGSDSFEASEPWYAVYAAYCAEKGIVAGLPDNLNVPAERAVFAAILASALPDEALEEKNAVADNAIPDVSLNDSWSPAVYKLYRAGILAGNDAEGTFAPFSCIKRSEVAAILTRMIDVSLRMSVTFGAAETAQTPADKHASGSDSPKDKPYFNWMWWNALMGGQKPDKPDNGKPDKPDNGDDSLIPVTFLLNDGTDGAYYLEYISSGKILERPDNPERNGYTFVGWFLDQDGYTAFDFAEEITSSTTLYAGWWRPLGETDKMLSASDSEVGTCYSVTEIEYDGSSFVFTINTNSRAELYVRILTNNDDNAEIASLTVPTPSYCELAQLAVEAPAELPQYFVIQAVLRDEEGNNLCDVYNCIHFTREYEEFRNQTIYDFPGKNVINFDANPQENFGVLVDSVILIESSETVNTMTVLSEEGEDGHINRQYIFANQNEEFRALKEGDIVCVGSSGYMFKIYAIVEDGDSTVITPSESVSIEDFYSYLKLNTDTLQSDAVPQQGRSLMKNRARKETDIIDLPPLSFPFDGFEVDYTIMDLLDVDVVLDGTVEVTLIIEYNLSLFDGYFAYTLITTTKMDAEVTIGFVVDNSKKLREEQELAKIPLPVLPGLDVYLAVTLPIEWSLSAGGEIVIHDYSQKGVKRELQGFDMVTVQEYDQKDITTDLMFEAEGEIKIGPKVSVGVEFLEEVLDVNLYGFYGVGANLRLEKPFTSNSQNDKHDCVVCITGNARLIVEAALNGRLSIPIIFDADETLTLFSTEKAFEVVPFTDKGLFYISIRNLDFSNPGSMLSMGWGPCPYHTFLTRFYIQNTEVKDNILLTIYNNEGAAVNSGTVYGLEKLEESFVTYLPNGTYKAKYSINGQEYYVDFEISDGYEVIRIILGKDQPIVPPHEAEETDYDLTGTYYQKAEYSHENTIDTSGTYLIIGNDGLVTFNFPCKLIPDSEGSYMAKVLAKYTVSEDQLSFDFEHDGIDQHIVFDIEYGENVVLTCVSGWNYTYSDGDITSSFHAGWEFYKKKITPVELVGKVYYQNTDIEGLQEIPYIKFIDEHNGEFFVNTYEGCHTEKFLYDIDGNSMWFNIIKGWNGITDMWLYFINDNAIEVQNYEKDDFSYGATEKGDIFKTR